MKSKIKALYRYFLNHKKISAVVLVVVILVIYGIFFRTGSSGTTTTQYVFSKVQKQNVVVSVTGSGQVSALDQVDISSEVSGTIDYVGVKAGDSVTKGKVIARLDSTDASRAVDNANINLTNAQVAYDKAKKLYGNQLGESSTTVSDLAQALDDGYSAVANAFIDLPKIFMDVSDIYYDRTNSPYFSDMNISSLGSDLGIKYKYEAGVIFDSAKKDYETVFVKYKNISADSNQEEITDLILKTRDLVKKLSSSLIGTYNTIDYISGRITGTIPNEVSTDKSLLSSYITKTTGHASKLSTALTTIEDAGNSTATADINLKSAQLSLNQAEDSLKSAKETLTNHTIVAPFDGVIAKVPIEVDDKVSNGASVATIITKVMKVSISLNEVDATKIKVGDKATLTFDAIGGLIMEGTIYEVDVLGTVSNGVVSYGVSISFDSTDDRIKAGMTTSVSISTGSASDTLAISSAAISSANGKSYVLVPTSNTTAESTTDKTTLKEVEVSTGLSGDVLTEITSGLLEGDTYVSGTKTITATKSTSGSLLGGLFGGPGSSRSNSKSSTSSSSSSSKTSSTNSQTQSGFGGGDMPMPPQ
jgi:multidrug efflux pump subunit AcrA (membrane-fusion protein)